MVMTALQTALQPSLPRLLLLPSIWLAYRTSTVQLSSVPQWKKQGLSAVSLTFPTETVAQ